MVMQLIQHQQKQQKKSIQQKIKFQLYKLVHQLEF